MLMAGSGLARGASTLVCRESQRVSPCPRQRGLIVFRTRISLQRLFPQSQRHVESKPNRQFADHCAATVQSV
jgi:hypothetical protein